MPTSDREPQRSLASSTSAPGAPNSVPSNAPLSLDSLLFSHSTAPDPKLAALEQALSERNVLSSQNSQLWKLVEKQRAGYNQIMKELERVRNERDTYKARLAAAADAGQGISASDRRVASRQASGASSSPAMTPSKQPLNRFYSDEQGKSPSVFLVAATHRTTVTPRSSSHPHTLKNSQSQEPLSYSSLNTPSSASLNASQTSQDPALAASHPAPRHKSSLPALVVPPRSESLPEVSATQETAPHSFRDTVDNSSSPSTAVSSSSHKYTHYTHGYSDSIMSSLSYTSTQTTPTAYSQKGSTSEPTSTPGSSVAPSTAGSMNGFDAREKSSSPDVPQITTSSPSNQSTESSHQALHPSSLTPGTAALSRDSRITLPDEAKQYIANMGESPLPSPRGDAFTRQTPPSQLSQSHVFPSEPPTTASSSASTHDAEDHEFLDMDEEDVDDDADTREVVDGYEVVNAPSDPQQDFVQPPMRQNSHTFAEDFPLPPSSSAPYEQPALKLDPTYTRQYQGNPLAASTSRSQRLDDAGMQSDPAPPSASGLFRALPLLATDLPHTKINVSHSFVRPNDRGKEVLSFMVHVDPGNAKEGWKVEKMYSDVLSLDQRVKNSVGKGIGKRIASLPEGKLWKDHAPAKVDQRKAVLENYLQTLINLPVKNNDEVIAFFTSDIVKETMQPVMQAGHKEGYLTKRGKNFGGWKTRYFVLQGPVLEYFDCRGGTHLGSITVTGAQIGRQQRNAGTGATDEEKEYRHAFLIVEAKKGPGGNHPRHVLCAESDAERDSWVEILVRYFSGTYNEEPVAYGPTPSSVNGSTPGAVQPPREPRTSITNDSGSSKKPSRGFSRDDISISKGAAVPLSQLPQDANNAKLFQGVVNPEEYASSSSPSKPLDIPSDRPPVFSDSQTAKRILERGQGQPSSLPDSSPLSNQLPASGSEPSQQRANSELGHYPDMQPSRQRHQSPERHRVKDPHKNALHTTGINLNSSPTTSSPSERIPSPEKMDANNKVKISGPLNGAPIPAGYKFGGKDAPSEPSSTPNDRREKAKSRSFWGFGRPNGPDKSVPVYVPRAVFGVTLDEALDVAQIANLPAIVFRCIQYLEAKKADQEEGIYRLSGSSAVIKSLKDRFNAEGDVDLLASDEYWILMLSLDC
ncbi:Rho GTPase activating protein [Stygiomarasmius scandens]|uniref:Rho GTPase activating protein n=1 Tax=Marasmiellus scandens TaxID=2682957 RepID=A0ABR1ILM7_9AGAR